ncbi:hypothetical protein SAMN05518672_11487 [Chitinophaga sp. CF118]|uniref:hypothetical protein n=1 Tax=Chitinophaga sp. CF118 TaxID=1884367 RepID=UPI0008E5F128|nr:hypothetical protein [Chitinophaga sp. CF118]SFF02243.1 hypothetical protein SAMN05518672_11487 [Chitinophaga sp. CF118]
MKKILITLLTCTCLFSCTKDDNNTPGSGNESYKPGNVITTDAPIMYTKNGIVHDQTLIKDYITRMGFISSYSFDQSAPYGGTLSSFTMTFTGDKSILLGNTKAEITSKNDTLMMIAAVESSTDQIGKKSLTDSLMDLVNKNGARAECPTYYTAPCSYRKKYPMLIANGNYYIPYVIATVSTTTSTPTSFGVPYVSTVFTHKEGQIMLFNENIIAELGKQLYVKDGSLTYIVDREDTLVIQRARQLMVKQ